MEQFESNNGQLIWNSGDTRGLSLVVNETEYNSASSTTYTDGTYVFNGFNSGKQDPSQLNFIEIASGIKAVVWSVDVWKDLGGGRWDSNYDLFYRVLDTNSGQFLTQEVRLTDDFSSDYLETVISDNNGGFSVVWSNMDGGYPFSVDVTPSGAGDYTQSNITSSAPEFESNNGQLIWNSGDTRGLSLVVNETEYNSASSTNGSFNGFNSGKQDPSQLNFIEIASGIKAVVWSVDVWKDLGGGRWDSNYDLFYRVLDTNSGQFLTQEVRLTDDFSSDYVETVISDNNGGFSVVWSNMDGGYPFSVDVTPSGAGDYTQSNITSSAPEFESNNGQLIWNSGDTRGLSLVVNETEYNSASSTNGSFNGFNSGKQDPSQLNFIEIASGIKAVVWSVDVWKDLGGGRWDSNYDLFYRVLDTNSGQFLTQEVRLTDDFSSDYVETVISDNNGGFSVVWSNTNGDILAKSVRAPTIEGEAYEEISGEVIGGSAQDDTIYGTDLSDIIHAGDGNDSIFPGLGNDIIYGGKGFDIAQIYGEISNYSLSEQSAETLFFSSTIASDTYEFFGVERIDFVGTTSSTSFYLDPYWDFEKAILGSGDDFFIGTSDKDYIETGGGGDEIYAGVGGDVIVVQGEDVYASPNYSPAAQTFTVRVQDGVYYVDGTPQPYLNLVAGETYRFDVSDPSNLGHPLAFATQADAYHTPNWYEAYNGAESFGWSTVAGPGEPGAYVDFTLPSDLADYSGQVYYFCQSHPGMGGSAAVAQPTYIEEDTDVIVIDTGTRTDPMSGETVSDGDADTVQVDSTFSGTLLIKNTGAEDRIEINKEIGRSFIDNDNDLKITFFDNENEIVIEDYYTVDQDGIYSNNGSLIKIDGWHDWHGGFPDADVYWSAGTGNADRLYSSILPGQAEEGIITTLSGRGGNDELFVGEGVNQIFGGEGVDKFFLESGQQHTSIIGDNTARVGDEYISPPIVTDGGMPDFSTENTDFGDSVYLGWLESEVTLKELYGPNGNNYFRIETNDGQSVVDLYDVEKLYFSDYVDEQDFKALTNGRVIGKEDWFGAANGVDIDYHQANVSFEIDGSIIRVKASGKAEVTEELIEEVYYWTNPEDRFAGRTWYEKDLPQVDFTTHPIFGGGDGIRNVEQINHGSQTYEKVFEDEVIWEGERSEVDYFDFAGSVDVNVVNVSPEDTAGDPIFGAPGTTDGIDLVFGTKDADFIDGRGGDDIIFGGGGDDVIIGGGGNDVIIGGDGSDILRGDSIDSNDAAYAAWQAGIAEFNAANPDNAVTFDENMLSMDNSGTNAGDGNDVIVGGDGLDDIKSGDGQNFVTSGKADIDGDGQANIDLINENIENHQHLLDDEDWV